MGELPYKPEEIEDADTMREVYENVDRTVRGQGHKTPMSASMRTEIAQAVVGLMRKNKQQTQLLGFGDPILAPTFAAGLASVLGVHQSVTAASQTTLATADPAATTVLRRPQGVTPCRSPIASERQHRFFSSAGPQPAVVRATRPWSQRERSVA